MSVNAVSPNPAFVFDPPPVPALAVQGTGLRFPVRRIFCVGRNYAAHAREMGHDPDREPPFFFTKPADAAIDAGIKAGAVVAYPPETRNLHHEVELVVALGKEPQGGPVHPAKALDLIFGYGVGIDLTRRDLQKAAKQARRPWDWAKAFDRSAPVSPLLPVAGDNAVFDPTRGKINLSVNGELRQQADLSDQIWPVADIIAAISRSMSLKAGDLIMTGTPSGVGPLQVGDRVDAAIDALADLRITIGPAEPATSPPAPGR